MFLVSFGRRRALGAFLGVRTRGTIIVQASSVTASSQELRNRQQSHALATSSSASAPVGWAAAGDQPQAIARLSEALNRGDKVALLRGATGTGERESKPLWF